MAICGGCEWATCLRPSRGCGAPGPSACCGGGTVPPLASVSEVVLATRTERIAVPLNCSRAVYCACHARWVNVLIVRRGCSNAHNHADESPAPSRCLPRNGPFTLHFTSTCTRYPTLFCTFCTSIHIVHPHRHTQTIIDVLRDVARALSQPTPQVQLPTLPNTVCLLSEILDRLIGAPQDGRVVLSPRRDRA